MEYNNLGTFTIYHSPESIAPYEIRGMFGGIKYSAVGNDLQELLLSLAKFIANINND